MEDEISQRIAATRSRSEFDISLWWLTFYLTAPPEHLDALCHELTSLNAVNLGGSEGGFLYPKVPTPNSTSAILAAIAEVEGMAALCGVEVIAIDADTSPDVSVSHSAELVRYHGNGG